MPFPASSWGTGFAQLWLMLSSSQGQRAVSPRTALAQGVPRKAKGNSASESSTDFTELCSGQIFLLFQNALGFFLKTSLHRAVAFKVYVSKSMVFPGRYRPLHISLQPSFFSTVSSAPQQHLHPALQPCGTSQLQSRHRVVSWSCSQAPRSQAQHCSQGSSHVGVSTALF